MRGWSLFVEAGIATALALSKASAGGPDGCTYSVVKGDVLSRLAQRFGIPAQELAKQNGIADPNRIHVGQTLNVCKNVETVPVILPPPPDVQPGFAVRAHERKVLTGFGFCTMDQDRQWITNRAVVTANMLAGDSELDLVILSPADTPTYFGNVSQGLTQDKLKTTGRLQFLNKDTAVMATWAGGRCFVDGNNIWQIVADNTTSTQNATVQIVVTPYYQPPDEILPDELLQ